MNPPEKRRKQWPTLRREAQEFVDAAGELKDDADRLQRSSTAVNNAGKATLKALQERLSEAHRLHAAAEANKSAMDESVQELRRSAIETTKTAEAQALKLEQATAAYASARSKIRADGQEQQAFLDKLSALYQDAEATELAKAYEKDSRGKVWVYWIAMAVALGGVLYMHTEAAEWYDHLVALPFYVATLLIWRGLSEQRMLQAECAHTARLLRAVVAFKRELPPTGAKEADVRTAALEAISKNPAERLKETSTSVWSFLETLYKTKGKGPDAQS